jgi:type IV pilus biogenesis protein PilP
LLPTEAALPAVAVSSKQVKTSDLQIAEARRDLPDVSVNDEIVSIIQADMSILPLDAPQPATPIQLASLTTPDQQLNATLLTRLPSTLSSDGIVNDATKQTAARPVRPPSPITAEPGTLTPTVEGTPGPEYITIYAGRPANEPRNRIDPLPPELELAGFRPRLRPDTLNVPAELLAAVEPEVVAEPTILDLADPALRPLRARLRPDTLVVVQPVLAETEVEPEAAPETETEVAVEDTTPEAIQEPTLLALADPALRPLRARLRPEALSSRAQTIVAQQEIAALGDPAMRVFRARLRPDTLVVPEIETTVTAVEEPATEEPVAQETEAAEPTDLAALVENAITQAGTETPEDTTDVIAAAIAQDSVVQAIQNEAAVLSFADPTLRPFRARTRPANLVPAAQLASLTTDGAQTQTDTGTSLLALADPTLSGVRARTRPGNLRVITPTEQSSLLSLADPSLAGKRTRARPRNLRIIAPEPAAIEPAVEPEIEDIVAPAERVINGTKQAVAISPKPKVRPRKLARVVQRVTREAARTNTTVRNDSGSDGTRTGVSTNGSTRATAKLPKSARGTVKSAPPVNATVARAATEKSRFKKSRMNVVGIFGAPNKRRALIRLPTGRYVKVQNGDKVGGWRVSAIGESSIRIKKGNRDQVLRIP